MGSGVISRFKENAPPKDLSMKKLSPFQSASGLRNLVHIGDIFNKRQEHGIMVLEGLRNAPGIILPKISSLTKPVFNRLPLLFEDTNRLSLMQNKLWAQGLKHRACICGHYIICLNLVTQKAIFPMRCMLPAIF